MDRSLGLDDMEKWKFLTLPGLELQPFDSPARSRSLYRLRYNISVNWYVHFKTELEM
jgi:hypothetical protein